MIYHRNLLREHILSLKSKENHHNLCLIHNEAEIEGAVFSNLSFTLIEFLGISQLIGILKISIWEDWIFVGFTFHFLVFMFLIRTSSVYDQHDVMHQYNGPVWVMWMSEWSRSFWTILWQSRTVNIISGT